MHSELRNVCDRSARNQGEMSAEDKTRGPQNRRLALLALDKATTATCPFQTNDLRLPLAYRA